MFGTFFSTVRVPKSVIGGIETVRDPNVVPIAVADGVVVETIGSDPEDAPEIVLVAVADGAVSVTTGKAPEAAPSVAPLAPR